MIIEELTLFTSNIQQQRHFYKNILGFEILEDRPDHLSFKTGKSVLNFQYATKVVPSHLAFNIPYNAIYDALKWLQARTAALAYNDTLVSDFSNWKAKAIYFYDADKNILEFIARERLDVESDIAFSPQAIMSISEMAIAVDDIKNIYEQIHQLKPISIFDGDFERFCAIGNDEGLFILINKHKKRWYPTQDIAFTSDFIIRGDYNFSFLNGKIEELL